MSFLYKKNHRVKNPKKIRGRKSVQTVKHKSRFMKKHILSLGMVVATSAMMAFSASAQKGASMTTMVGGNEMYPAKNIVENAMNSKDHTTLVAAVKAAGLVETLQGKGPFTVFAPVNDAFENLPEGTVDMLLKPENKDMLVKVLTYHVVAGKMDFETIGAAIKKGNGMATLTTVSGGKLVAKMNGAHNITVTDENGNTANISTYDVYQSNGVIHVLDKVVLPKM